MDHVFLRDHPPPKICRPLPPPSDSTAGPFLWPQAGRRPARVFLKEMPEFVQFHHNQALARIRLKARRVRFRRIQFSIDGVETPSCLAMAFIDMPKVYNNTAVSFFHSGSPRGGLKLVCRPQSLHFHFAGAALRVGTP